MKKTKQPAVQHDGGDAANRDLNKARAVAAARLADDKKAEAIVIYDMAGRSGITDFIVAATVDNPVQLEAVDEDIAKTMKKDGLFALYRDGGQSKNWRVLDYGGLMIHVFERKAREVFAFDEIYADYGQVKWRKQAAAPVKKAPKRAKPAARPRPAAKKKKPAVKKSPAAKKKKK